MKPDKVILLDEAVDDLEIGRRFYDDQEEGIGTYFVTSLLSDIASLNLHAGIHSIHFGFHRMLSKRFPFAVYYGVVPGLTRVVAALDMRQDPRGIRKALEERKNESGRIRN
ncbi:MAG: hypothetical protein WD342_19935 [Verrucomicrobiales bacterium]